MRPLVLALDVPHDAPVEREVREARIATADAALAELEGDPSEPAASLRAELETERQIAAAAESSDGRPTFPGKLLRRKALAARRKRLLALRSDGVIGDEAFHRLEEEMDLADLALATSYIGVLRPVALPVIRLG